jgi:hypothetical protein
MKLIDFLANGNRAKTLPKTEIPALLGEIETLKARLWLRLTEWEEVEPMIVLARKMGKRRENFVEEPRAILERQTPIPEWSHTSSEGCN